MGMDENMKAVPPKETPPRLLDFLDNFAQELEHQLREDDKRWGDTWLKRTRAGQEERIRQTFENYWDRHFNAGTPIPWLKIVGNAYIAWVRENRPDLFPE